MANNPYQKITQKATKTQSYGSDIKKSQTKNPYLKYIKANQSNTPFQDIINKAQKTNTYNERVKQSKTWYRKKMQSEPWYKGLSNDNDDSRPGEGGFEDEPTGKEFRPESDKSTDTLKQKESKDKGNQPESETPEAEDEMIVPSYPAPGWMFSFSYNPKHAETLEYYDTFPLILVVSSTPTFFMGVNFHYLRPIERAAFLDVLQKYVAFDEKANALTINMSYPILMAKTELAYFRPCFKMYLTSHVVGNVSPILPTEWDIAMFVPSEQFKKATKEQVWADSSRKIRDM